MELSNNYLIKAPKQNVWEALNDPEVLKKCIPGCESIEALSENTHQVVVSAKIGPVSARFKGFLTLQNVIAPSSYSIVFEGQGGSAGFAKGEAGVSLEAEENGTRLTYTAQAKIGGKIAQIGSRLVDGAAKKMADEFFGSFNKHVVSSEQNINTDADIRMELPAGKERRYYPIRSWAPWVFALAALSAAVYFIS